MLNGSIRESWGRSALPLVCILAYLLAALPHLRFPGIEYDEILFGNAALGPIDGMYVTAKIGPVPLLLMEYIGALKAWLFMPIFALCGVSPETIRIPMLLLSAGTLVLVYFA